MMNRQKGFSLLEVLVAFLILSVGLLGVASLQATSIRAGTSSMLRTLSLLSSQEIIERMQANTSAIPSYASALSGAPTAPTPRCSQQNGAIAAACTPEQLAINDVFEWKQNLAAQFGGLGAQSSITVTPQGNLMNVAITIQWDERTSQRSTQANTVDDGTVQQSYAVNVLILPTT